jgi:hypothetical protein
VLRSGRCQKINSHQQVTRIVNRRQVVVSLLDQHRRRAVKTLNRRQAVKTLNRRRAVKTLNRRQAVKTLNRRQAVKTLNRRQAAIAELSSGNNPKNLFKPK